MGEVTDRLDDAAGTPSDLTLEARLRAAFGFATAASGPADFVSRSIAADDCNPASPLDA